MKDHAQGIVKTTQFILEMVKHYKCSVNSVPNNPFNTSLWCLLGIRQSVDSRDVQENSKEDREGKELEKGEKVEGEFITPKIWMWRNSSIPACRFH